MEASKTNFLTVFNKDTVVVALAKGIVFGMIGSFVLYLPLGEPNYTKNYDAALCLTCDVLSTFYELTISLGQKIITIVYGLMCSISDLLHGLKLMCYELLEKIDGEELCQSICCDIDGESAELSQALKTAACNKVCRKRDQCRSK